MKLHEVIKERHDAIVQSQATPIYQLVPNSDPKELPDKELVGHQVVLDTSYADETIYNVGFRPKGAKKTRNIHNTARVYLIDALEDVVKPAMQVGFQLSRTWSTDNGATQHLQFIHPDYPYQDIWDHDGHFWANNGQNGMFFGMLIEINHARPDKAVIKFDLSVFRMICTNGMVIRALELQNGRFLARQSQQWDVGRVLADGLGKAAEIQQKPEIMLGESKPTEIVQKAFRYIDHKTSEVPALSSPSYGLHRGLWQNMLSQVESWPNDNMNGLDLELVLTNAENHYLQNSGRYRLENASRQRAHSRGRINAGLNSLRDELDKTIKMAEFFAS